MFRSLVDEIIHKVETTYKHCERKGVIVVDITKAGTVWFINPVILAHLAQTFRVRTTVLLLHFDACVYIAPKIYKYSADCILRLFPLTSEQIIRGFLPEDRSEFEHSKFELETGRSYATI